jgi:hypothetical protein
MAFVLWRNAVAGFVFRSTTWRSVVQILPHHQNKDEGSCNAPFIFRIKYLIVMGAVQEVTVGFLFSL